jgi:hypothetical protein
MNRVMCKQTERLDVEDKTWLRPGNPLIYDRFLGYGIKTAVDFHGIEMVRVKPQPLGGVIRLWRIPSACQKALVTP